MELADIDDDITAFLVESDENLNQIEQDIIALEKGTIDAALPGRIYRALHTLKGNCGFLPFPILESLAHAGEGLVSGLRDRQLTTTPELIHLLLQLIDAIRQVLFQIETTQQEGTQDYAGLIHAVTEMQSTDVLTSPPTEPLPVDQSLVSSSLDERTVAIERRPPFLRAIEQPASDSPPLLAETYVRVQVGVLDRLMNVMSQLVLVRNQVLGYASTASEPTMTTIGQRLNQTTMELQEGVMKLRLQPIRVIWQKFPRMVRDLAIASGKQVQIRMEGSDTELDRNLLDAIKDPLMHLVRNCIDHGIEPPHERRAQGKAIAGQLTLRAFHQNGQVHIHIGDDGRGLQVEHLKQRAKQLGILSPEQVHTLEDADVVNLMFIAGVSTAAQITHLSGRGVGMDVVKSNLQKVNGTIEVHTHPGQGTTFTIKIPLTLTILPTLMVKSGGERFAIAQGNLQEVVQVDREAITSFYNVPVYRLRDRLLPLIDLNRVLQLPDRMLDDVLLSLVVIQVEGYHFGLLVDQIEDTQEVVVKPLGSQLQSLSVFAGATILGDGRVALILDPVGLAAQAGITMHLQQQIGNALALQQLEDADNRQQLVLFQGPEGARMGIPMAIAVRLEEISRSAIETVNQQPMVRYHQDILPLIDLHTQFGRDRRSPLGNHEPDEQLQVIVVTPCAGCRVGLVVDRIVDIVEEPLTIQGMPSRPGILCNAVIQNQITELLDVNTVIRAVNPHWLQGVEDG